MFGETPKLPTMPQAPAPPPLFGANTGLSSQKKQAAGAGTSGFAGTILGARDIQTPTPGQPGAKTLLGA